VWPFKNKPQSIEDLQVNDAWTVAQGDHDGKPMFVRFNGGFRDFRGKSRYPHQVGIAVPLRSPEETGLPSPQEISELGAIEDSICEVLEAEKESLLVVVVTTSGMQEFVFYTRSPEQVKVKVGRLRGTINGHEIQLMIQEDRDWQVYAHLTHNR